MPPRPFHMLSDAEGDLVLHPVHRSPSFFYSRQGLPVALRVMLLLPMTPTLRSVPLLDLTHPLAILL
ncbi:hypothetical protein NDU88_002348 [Pleurodeles waltl]|uniref:Uncharacterized protein n=1 Tax=Pleurodeles waltl TaxID=8319 RepID=A0AAV7KVF0_PLEWA|nr:hypothetical protein NDU88_002348 [Pleurodeles waltl]